MGITEYGERHADGSYSAVYSPAELDEYAGNPFIEALPHIMSEDEIIEYLTVTPSIRDEDRLLPDRLRFHKIKRIKDFLHPLEEHFIIQQRLSELIRSGYLGRNPLDPAFLTRLRVLNELQGDDDIPQTEQISSQMQYIQCTAESFSIIGVSGMGKTTAIERLLRLYPQVIRHDEYNGKLLNKTQIVWLKIDCPYDGSLSTLCKNFFQSIDTLLGTNYLAKYGILNRVTSTMLINMTRLVCLYGIGVLVIDEIQHLLQSKNDQYEMLNFFVTLSNTVGVPTVLIGTPSAKKLFTGNFRQARRVASAGNIIWDRMVENSPEWEVFLESLWEFQCLRERVPLTKELKRAFYYECQGITSVAISLFVLAQDRAVAEGSERLTAQLLKTTVEKDLAFLMPMLKAIRNNDIASILKYEDISVDFEQVLNDQKLDFQFHERIKAVREQQRDVLHRSQADKAEEILVWVAEAGLDDNLTTKELEIIIRRAVESSPEDTDLKTLRNQVLREIIARGEPEKKENKLKKTNMSGVLVLPLVPEIALKKKRHPYEELKDLGYIKNPLVEFYM